MSGKGPEPECFIATCSARASQETLRRFGVVDGTEVFLCRRHEDLASAIFETPGVKDPAELLDAARMAEIVQG